MIRFSRIFNAEATLKKIASATGGILLLQKKILVSPRNDGRITPRNDEGMSPRNEESGAIFSFVYRGR